MSPTIRRILGLAAFGWCLYVLQGYAGVLEFNREKVLSGEVWRLWTAHLVHTNSVHFVLNVTAAALLYIVFSSKLRLNRLAFYGLVFAALISVALLWVYPFIGWYNGLSGLLHALFACYCVRLAMDGERLFWPGLVLVWVKVLAETTAAHLGHMTLIAGMTVITEAHLVGVLLGTVAAFGPVIVRRIRNDPERLHTQAR
jgi:rhomboid family GlyGly-CTERM serine protease